MTEGWGGSPGSRSPWVSLGRQIEPSLSLSPHFCLFPYLFPSNLMPQGPCLLASFPPPSLPLHFYPSYQGSLGIKGLADLSC